MRNGGRGRPVTEALDVIGNQRVSSNDVSADLPRMWCELRRGNAAGRLHLLLRVSRLRAAAQTEQGRLLRVLLIRDREVPASPGIGPMLRVRAMTSACWAIFASLCRGLDGKVVGFGLTFDRN